MPYIFFLVNVIFIFDFLFDYQIYHAENKFGPFSLLSAINEWRRDDTATNTNSSESGSSAGLISEISEIVSCQLHGGIMKAVRKVLLDEIISNLMAEAASSRKVRRHLKLEMVEQMSGASNLYVNKVLSGNVTYLAEVCNLFVK